jgi:hypothetical protein
MKKIRLDKLSIWQRATITGELRDRLLEQHPDIAERPGKVTITEAREMSGDRVKLTGHVYSDAEGYWYFTRVIGPASGSEGRETDGVR